jgi:hypothetical protein
MRDPVMLLWVCKMFVPQSLCEVDELSVGSCAAEGYNSRLDTIMPSKPLALDKMVDFLAGEDEYWRRVVNDPRLWRERTKNNAAAKEKHLRKRCRLAFYRNHSEDVNHQSKDLSSWNVLGESDDDVGEDMNALLPDDSPVRQPESEDHIHKKDGCKKCGQAKTMNKACSLRMCKACCIDSTEECKLTDHKCSKKHAPAPYLQSSLTNSSSSVPEPTSEVVEKINLAIKNKSPVYISSQNARIRTDLARFSHCDLYQARPEVRKLSSTASLQMTPVTFTCTRSATSRTVVC